MHLIKNIKNKSFLNRTLVSLLAVTFIWLVADVVLEFVFPTRLEHLGKSYFEIGLLLSLASLGGIIVDFPVGKLSDKANRKKIMISGLVLSILATIFIFSFDGDITLTMGFLFWGAAYQIWKVPRDAKFASQTSGIQRGHDYGLDMEIKYLAQTVGAFLGGFILLYLGFRGTIGYYSISLIIAIVLLYFLITERRQKPVLNLFFHSPKSISVLNELKELRFTGLFLLLFFAFLFTAWEEILWAFQPLFYGSNVLNIPSHLGGLLLACFSLPGIFLSYPAGILADKIGKRIVLAIGMGIIGLGLIFFSFSHQLLFIFGLALTISIGWSTALPALNGLIIDLSSNQKKGEIVGLWDLFMDIGFVIGPIIGGAIAEFFGVRGVFLVMGSVFLINVFFLCGHSLYQKITKESES
ncbi:MFS transporter [Candidatus Woesearchaeota archaeon]|nr:MFS transporter [Candidatus Woesearchaeota archaeon]